MGGDDATWHDNTVILYSTHEATATKERTNAQVQTHSLQRLVTLFNPST